jgi:hypothetical protein
LPRPLDPRLVHEVLQGIRSCPESRRPAFYGYLPVVLRALDRDIPLTAVWWRATVNTSPTVAHFRSLADASAHIYTHTGIRTSGRASAVAISERLYELVGHTHVDPRLVPFAVTVWSDLHVVAALQKGPTAAWCTTTLGSVAVQPVWQVGDRLLSACELDDHIDNLHIGLEWLRAAR